MKRLRFSCHFGNSWNRTLLLRNVAVVLLSLNWIYALVWLFFEWEFRFSSCICMNISISPLFSKLIEETFSILDFNNSLDCHIMMATSADNFIGKLTNLMSVVCGLYGYFTLKYSASEWNKVFEGKKSRREKNEFRAASNVQRGT